MAENTVQGKVGCRVMTAETTDADPTDAVKGDPMAEGTGILDISRRIMKGIIRTGPGDRVGVVDLMAPRSLTAGVIDTFDADVKTGVAARTAGLAMAALAHREVGLGVGTVIRRVQVGAIYWMWCLARSLGMTAEAVITAGIAAGSRLAAMQVRTMTPFTF